MVKINTKLGAIEGVEKSGAISFLGIPYAAAPVGERRWRPPVAPQPWSGVYSATRHPNRAFQVPFPEDLAPPGGIPGEFNEDMLYLNVHVPKGSSKGPSKPHPVMVYIHGGGYTVGSANDFDPGPYAARSDLVVVAINYRLGMLGFLDLSRFGADYAGSANLGFQDQIAALQWVAQNIADYGGDPQNVTICGCSAGGGSVIALMSAPSARGLFHKAVAMSPLEVSLAPPDIITPCAAAMELSEEAFFHHLQSLSAADLFAFQSQSGVGSSACVDGEIIVQPTVKAIQGGINSVPLITGCTLAEGPFLTDGITAAMGNDPAIFQALEGGMATNAGGGDAARYSMFLNEFSQSLSPAERLNRVWYDYFRSYVVRTAQALSEAGLPAWVYTFAVPTEHPYGPTHGSDVPFVFDSISSRAEGEMHAFYTNNPTNRKIAALWSQTFLHFIRSDVPNWAGIPDWPVYKADRRACLVLEEQPIIANNPDGDDALRAYGL